MQLGMEMGRTLAVLYGVIVTFCHIDFTPGFFKRRSPLFTVYKMHDEDFYLAKMF